MTAPSPTPVVTTPAPIAARAPAPTQLPPGWDATWKTRFSQVASRVKRSPGQLSVVLVDRETGLTWQTGSTGAVTWTGSTIKLAMTAYVLERARAGAQVTANDRADLSRMLKVSDDAAAERIWARFGRHDMLPTFRQTYGMTSLKMAGSNNDWGALACRSEDLSNLMTYVLTKLNAEDRAYIVDAMRHVGSIQNWGVWSVGASLEPGNKNGWLEDEYNGKSHWHTSSVGFVGPNQRYVLAMMYQMPTGQDSLQRGAQTLSDLSAALFGKATPAPANIRPS